LKPSHFIAIILLAGLVVPGLSVNSRPLAIFHQATPVASPTTEGQSDSDLYIALGDSIAAGTGASVPERQGYVARLHQLIEIAAGSPVSLVNLSVPGATSEDLISNQIPMATQLVELSADQGRKVSAITISIGANDVIRAGATQSDREEALDRVRLNLDEALGALQEALIGHETPIVVVGYYDVDGGDPTIVDSVSWWAKQMNSTLTEVSLDHDAIFVDIA
jgi:lysophospholipase L1-like esterase